MRVRHNHVKFNKNCSICNLLKEFSEEGRLNDEQYELYKDFITALIIFRKRLIRSLPTRSVNHTVKEEIKDGENDFSEGAALAIMSLLLHKK